jgi:DNA (cytosine-5)-methyltransferase 1
MNVLDLFSGIGGFSLGLERAGMTTVAFCEVDPFCRRVLAKHWPEVPIYEDVRELDAARLRRDGIDRIDVITGGYPCQPFSHAGKRGGSADPRHLWPAMRRVIGEVRPAWVVAENVAGHISLGLDQVLADLEADGYSGRAIVVPAAAVDAPHIRQRVWIVARDSDSDSESARAVDAKAQGLRGDMADADGIAGRQRRASDREQICGDSGARSLAECGNAGRGGFVSDLADANQPGSQGHGRLRERAGQCSAGTGRRPVPRAWEPEPAVGRVAHGIPARVDRLRALGNAVVPQIPEMIGRAIMEHAV